MLSVWRIAIATCKMVELTQDDNCVIPRWQLIKDQLSNLSFKEFQERSATQKAVILDVRRADEIQEGRLPEAIHIDYFSADLVDQLEVLDHDVPYFVYCRSGRRSLRVCALMRNAGFKEVHNLDGGLISRP